MAIDLQTTPERVAVAADAELKALGDVPVDDVLGVIDQEMPDYRQLYYRWERQQWEAGAIDFSGDRRDWRAFSPELQRSFLSVLSSFYVGAERATNALVPFVDALVDEEHQVFLTTQLVDEARHTVFFDRFYSDVLDQDGDDMKAQVDRQVGRVNAGFRTLLLEMLPDVARRIREQRGDLTALVEGVVLHHIVIEATLALTGQRFLLNFIRDQGVLPGFRQGFTAVARDECRHVAFGVRFLRDVVGRDERCAGVIRAALDRIVPIATDALAPPAGDSSYFDPLPYGPEELHAFALNSLEKRTKAIGVE